MSGYPIELMTFMTHSSKLGTAVVVSDPWSCNCHAWSTVSLVFLGFFALLSFNMLLICHDAPCRLAANGLLKACWTWMPSIRTTKVG